MTKNTPKRSVKRLAARLRKARLKLTEEELQFFPRRSSMPDQPQSQWMPTDQAAAAISERSVVASNGTS